MPRITIPSLSGKKKKKKHPAFLPPKPPPPSLLPPKLPVVITHSRRSRSKGSPAHLSARGSSALNDQPLGGQECCLVLFPSPTHLKAGRGGGRAAAGTFFSSRASPCVEPVGESDYRPDSITSQPSRFRLFSLSHFPLQSLTTIG